MRWEMAELRRIVPLGSGVHTHMCWLDVLFALCLRADLLMACRCWHSGWSGRCLSPTSQTHFVITLWRDACAGTAGTKSGDEQGTSSCPKILLKQSHQAPTFSPPPFTTPNITPARTRRHPLHTPQSAAVCKSLNVSPAAAPHHECRCQTQC